MFSVSYSAALQGIKGSIVHVEADVSDGMPFFSMVGYLASEVKEAKERVRIAIKNQGFDLKPKRITINLSPADLKKEGTAFDLPIAAAILASSGYFPKENLEGIVLIGELNLDGKISGINGVLPIIYTAFENGFRKCIVPSCNAKEGAVIEGMEVIGVESLKEVVEYLAGVRNIIPVERQCFAEELKNVSENTMLDFKDVIGQKTLIRALEIAAAGRHNVLMIGPPGSGKTMAAKRIPGILPSLSLEESIEISKIYSISGLLKEDGGLVTKRPFRSPHHTITSTALVGGGITPKPGEVSLSSGGVLFLDELPEFNKGTLEILRQPLEEKEVHISRLNGNYCYPADFMLVAAMNPCNCGYYPDRKRCNCSVHQVKRYLGRISEPLLDRIDICTEVMPVSVKMIQTEKEGKSSKEMKEQVEKARKIQAERYKEESILFNSHLNSNQIKKYCALGKAEKDRMEQIFQKYKLSTRAYHRILKVARTIADLEGAREITTAHINEAFFYRSLDKKYWG